MAVTIDWGTQVITIPKADLTLISGILYELDVDAFRLELKNLEDDEAGMPFIRTHNHNTTVTLAGAVYARSVEIINGYTIEFEDGMYAVRMVGANHNIADVAIVNQVSLRTFNSAGLIQVSSGSGLSSGEQAELTAAASDSALVRKVVAGRRIVVAPDDLTITVYEDDNIAVAAVYSVAADGRLREKTA